MKLAPLLFALQGERVLSEVSYAGQSIWVTRTLTGTRVNLRTGAWEIQSAVSVRNPARPLYFPYRMAEVMLGRLPGLRRFLLIGTGGGTIVHMVRKHCPGAHVTAVDINPVMPVIARQYFGMPEVETVVADAADFMQGEHQPYDGIFVDAFAGMRTPPGLRTPAFWRNVARLLAPEGITGVNAIRRCPLDRENVELLQNFAEAFPFSAVVFRHPPILLPVNVVAFGTAAPVVTGSEPAPVRGRAGSVWWQKRCLSRGVRWQANERG